MEKGIIESINEKLMEIDNISNNFRKYQIKPTGIITLSSSEHIELNIGLFIKDISTHQQITLGITILHIYTTQKVKFDKHLHENQGQIIHLKAGNIIHDEKKYYPGEICMIPKNENHSIIYEKDTEAILIYLPNLPLL